MSFINNNNYKGQRNYNNFRKGNNYSPYKINNDIFNIGNNGINQQNNNFINNNINRNYSNYNLNIEHLRNEQANNINQILEYWNSLLKNSLNSKT